MSHSGRNAKWVLLHVALLTTVIHACSSKLFAQLPVLPRTDNQVWNDVQIAIPVTEQFDFMIFGTLRLGRGALHPVDERIGVGFTFKAGKYVTVQPNYLRIATQPVAGIPGLFENRLSLNAQVRLPVGKFTLSDRNIVERRLRGPLGKTTRYRNRFQVEHPIGPAKWNLRILSSDEVFYDSGPNAWVRNRFLIGFSKTYNKHFTQDFYYLRQNDGRARPGNLNVFGVVWRLRG